MKLKIKIILESEYNGNTSGWPTRYIGLISSLNKYHDLHIFAPGNTKKLNIQFPNAKVCPSTEVNTIVKPKGGIYYLLKDFIFLSDKYVRSSARVTNYPYSQKFHNLLISDKNRYDLSLYFGKASYIFYGKDDSTQNKFCDFCDSVIRMSENKLMQSSSIIEKLSIYYDIFYTKRVKKHFFKKDIKVLCITEKENGFISSVLPKCKVLTIPNGTDLKPLTINSDLLKKKFESKTILFIGSLGYPPNENSITYTLKNIWPEIYKKFPEYKFQIVGRNPSNNLKKLACKTVGVDFVGEVDDVYEYYINAKCFLGPMFTGGGMKNKFLESMSAGTPIITTEEGVIGIDFIHGKHGLCNNNFIENTISIINCDYDSYTDYVKNCIELLKKYTWDSIGKDLNKLLLDNILIK